MKVFGRIVTFIALGLAVALSASASVESIPGQALRPGDELLEGLVLEALSADPIVESFEIVVTAYDGAVRLNGSVGSDAERARAGAIAADTEGVVEVDNRITVEQSLLPTDLTDAEIRAEILRHFVAEHSSGEMIVSVDDGLAILTGKVASKARRRMATEIAFGAGAMLVKNQLEVARTPKSP